MRVVTLKVINLLVFLFKNLINFCFFVKGTERSSMIGIRTTPNAKDPVDSYLSKLNSLKVTLFFLNLVLLKN